MSEWIARPLVGRHVNGHARSRGHLGRGRPHVSHARMPSRHNSIETRDMPLIGRPPARRKWWTVTGSCSGSRATTINTEHRARTASSRWWSNRNRAPIGASVSPYRPPSARIHRSGRCRAYWRKGVVCTLRSALAGKPRRQPPVEQPTRPSWAQSGTIAPRTLSLIGPGARSRRYAEATKPLSISSFAGGASRLT